MMFAISEVVNAAATAMNADFVFYDAGPNIGALNREVVLGNRVIFGSVNANRRHYEAAIDALSRADSAWLHAVITRRVPLDRWREASELLAETEAVWRGGNPTSAMLGELTSTMARLWTGSPEPFEAGLAARHAWPPRSVRRHRLDQVDSHVTALLVIGDAHRVEQLLAEEGLAAERLPLYCRAMLAAARGAAEAAVDLARRAIVGADHHGHETRSAGMYASVVSVLVARGELAAAKQLLAVARRIPPTLAHLLDIAHARLDRALGDEDTARTRLRNCAVDAGERGLVVGTDLVWHELVDLALVRGDRAEAEEGLAALTRLSELMPTGRTTLLTLLARATVEKDDEAASACLRLARDRAQPLEQATVVERLVRHGAMVRPADRSAYARTRDPAGSGARRHRADHLRATQQQPRAYEQNLCDAQLADDERATEATSGYRCA